MEPAQQPDTSEPQDSLEFPIVGIGGSAGGLAAVQHFFAAMPVGSGMAFVVILHLSPEYESNLAQVIRQSTTMPVVQVTETVVVEREHVYVIAPNKELSMVGGRIELSDPEKPRGQRAPIDLFFRTLAESHGSHAAAVVLSGTGADGSIGLARVKENGGITIVQDPNEAQYDAMPRNAIATGLVDMTLPVAEIPERLIDCWRDDREIHLPAVDVLSAQGGESETLRTIFALMRARTGHDFSQYKLPTILRRIRRRMTVQSVSSLPAYLRILRSHPEEPQALLRDLLISVTNFFRDAESWQALNRVIPSLFADREAGDMLRVWVVGCATGEEAYSVARLLYEYAEALPYRPNIQIFATDIDEDAIAHARQGLYLNTIGNDVSPERLQRFFTAEQSHYRVRREIRDMVLFAVHNVLHDPPFSRLDLVTCRNVLIYLNRSMQEQVLQLFHFTLRPNGYLLLGSSESTDGVPGLFTPINKTQRLYQRRLVPTVAGASVPALPVTNPLRQRQYAPRAGQTPAPSFSDLDAYVLAHVGPPTIIVNEDYEIVHLARGAGQFLDLADGEPTHNLLKIIHRDLRLELRTALFAAIKERTSVETNAVLTELEGERCLVQATVEPLDQPEWARGYIAVIFRTATPDGGQSLAVTSDGEPIIHRLEDELQRTKDQLRTTIEQYETMVEEYKAANEELQAINEELRAATEELETSKEELQSVNEELTTVNQELKHKIEEVSQSNNDLQNFMASTSIGTIFVDRELRIKRYTPSVEAVFNLIPADVNRPLAHITHKLEYDELAQDAMQVLATLIPIEREIHSNEGRWYLVHLQPYRTLADLINGVVLSFVDITERKQSSAAMEAAEAGQRAILDSANQSIMLIAPDYRLELFNRYAAQAALRMFGQEMQVGQSMLEYMTPEDHEGFIEHFQQALRGQEVSIEKQIHNLHDADWWEFFYYPIKLPTGEVSGVTFTSRNIGERKRAEQALRQSEAKYRTLFDSIEEGFCIIEMIDDESGNAIDYRFLEVNRAFERQTGIVNAAGKLGREIAPNTESYWLKGYSSVARTGEALRVENYNQSTGRWYLSYASRIGEAGSRQVALVFEDITERKQQEQRQEYLLKLSDALRPLDDAVEIQATVNQTTLDYFGADRCYYCEIKDHNVVIRRDASRADLPSVVGGYSLSSMPMLQAVIDAGQAFIVQDANTTDLLDEELKQLCIQLQVISFINVPVIKNGQPVGVLY